MKQLMRKLTFKRLGIMLAALLIVQIVPVHTAFAAEPTLADVLPPSMQNALGEMVAFVVVILRMGYALLIPILGLIGKFLSNDWVMGNIFDFDVIIETVWLFVRRFVNIGIIVYLLALAAGNIFNLKGDRFSMQKQLPMAIAALVLVNFSLFFCRTILSVSNIATSMAFSIPQEVTGELFESDFFNRNIFIWAEPVGGADTSYAQCGSYYSLALVSGLSDQEKAAVSNSIPGFEGQYVCTQLNSDILKTIQTTVGSSPELEAAISTPYIAPKSQVNQNSFVMECLHQNYAVKFDKLFVAQHGTAIFANPTLVNGEFEPGPFHYKRISFPQSKVEDKENPDAYAAYLEKLKLYSTYIEAQVSNPQTAMQNAVSGNANSGFPYYSDCILGFEELAFSARNAMFVYAFNLMKIPSYEGAFRDISGFGDISVRLFLAAVYLGMFLLLNIGLLVVVVARGFFLWIMMMLSPLWVVRELLGFKSSGGENSDVMGGFVSFTKLAFMPALIGLVLSLGFIMYHFLSVVGAKQGLDAGRLQVGSINLWFDANNAIVSGIGNVFETMFALLAMAALWFGIWASASFGFGKNKLMAGFIQKYQGFGAALGKFAARAPLEAPIIPFPGGGQSLSSISQLPKTVMGAFDEKRSREKRSRQDALSKFVGEATGLGTPGNFSDQSDARGLKRRVSAAAGSTAALNEIAGLFGSYDARDKEIRRLLAQLVESTTKKDGTVDTSVSRATGRFHGETIELTGDALRNFQSKLRGMGAVVQEVHQNKLHDLSTDVLRPEFESIFRSIQPAFSAAGIATPPAPSTTTPATPPAAPTTKNVNLASLGTKLTGITGTVSLSHDSISALKNDVTTNGLTSNSNAQKDIHDILQHFATTTTSPATAESDMMRFLRYDIGLTKNQIWDAWDKLARPAMTSNGSKVTPSLTDRTKAEDAWDKATS